MNQATPTRAWPGPTRWIITGLALAVPVPVIGLASALYVLTRTSAPSAALVALLLLGCAAALAGAAVLWRATRADASCGHPPSAPPTALAPPASAVPAGAPGARADRGGGPLETCSREADTVVAPGA